MPRFSWHISPGFRLRRFLGTAVLPSRRRFRVFAGDVVDGSVFRDHSVAVDVTLWKAGRSRPVGVPNIVNVDERSAVGTMMVQDTEHHPPLGLRVSTM